MIQTHSAARQVLGRVSSTCQALAGSYKVSSLAFQIFFLPNGRNQEAGGREALLAPISTGLWVARPRARVRNSIAAPSTVTAPRSPGTRRVRGTFTSRLLQSPCSPPPRPAPRFSSLSKDNTKTLRALVEGGPPPWANCAQHAQGFAHLTETPVPNSHPKRGPGLNGQSLGRQAMGHRTRDPFARVHAVTLTDIRNRTNTGDRNSLPTRQVSPHT